MKKKVQDPISIDKDVFDEIRDHLNRIMVEINAVVIRLLRCEERPNPSVTKVKRAKK